MQAIKNKLRRNSVDKKHAPVFDNTAAMDPNPTLPGGVVTEFQESHRDLPSGTHVDQYEKTEVVDNTMMSSIPVPPPMPSSNFWRSNINSYTGTYDHLFLDRSTSSTSTTYIASDIAYSSSRAEVLPVEVIEKPVVIHESIRQEQVEEIQPVVRVEREKTEIRQITQPLTDKEIRPVLIEERTLPVEVLPTIINQTAPRTGFVDQSTQEFDATRRQVIEKKPIIQETEKWRIIEEVQPIIYREVIVPHVIRTSRPMREVIVEAPIFTEQTLQVRDLSAMERQRWSNFFTQESVMRETMSSRGSLIPVTSISDPVSLPIRTVSATSGQREVLEEVVTTTTTTTAAPIVGSVNRSSRSSSASRSSNNLSSTLNTQPQVLENTHDVKLGPNGETITRDTMTTSSFQPTLVN